jgi:hypothetical protein
LKQNLLPEKTFRKINIKNFAEKTFSKNFVEKLNNKLCGKKFHKFFKETKLKNRKKKEKNCAPLPRFSPGETPPPAGAGSLGVASR